VQRKKITLHITLPPLPASLSAARSIVQQAQLRRQSQAAQAEANTCGTQACSPKAGGPDFSGPTAEEPRLTF